MYKIYKYFYKTNIFVCLLYAISLTLFVNFSIVFLYTSLGFDTTNSFNNYNINLKDFLLIVVFAPFTETLLFQYTPLKIASLFHRKKYTYCVFILISSIIFGSLHWKSTAYMIITFFYGIIWSYFCLLFIRRKQHPIFFTSLIHACYNGILILITFLLE
ncbi:MAG: CPBP family intramembrane metalloprotease [Porphyromonadaceae bacterium]|nr:CPBP family intramembrane metalloprotease [Porphyromonadaceae bacterium]